MFNETVETSAHTHVCVDVLFSYSAPYLLDHQALRGRKPKGQEMAPNRGVSNQWKEVRHTLRPATTQVHSPPSMQLCHTGDTFHCRFARVHNLASFTNPSPSSQPITASICYPRFDGKSKLDAFNPTSLWPGR